MSFPIFAAIGFLFGIGFGYFIQRAGFCIAHGLGEIFMGKGKRILRFLTVIFIITGIGFLISGFFDSSLGLKPIGQIRASGFLNILAGMFFGAGILLNGGCILGTLRQIGEGNLLFVVILISFIPGMALVVYVIDPILKGNYNIQKLLLPQVFSTPAVLITGILALVAAVWLFYMFPGKKKKKG